MPDFTSMFLDFTRDFESPSSFWRWASYSLISSVLRDSVYWVEGEDRIFPNLYVLLLSDSAMYRKGRPVRIAQKLLTKLKVTNVVSGRSSIQAILSDMSVSVSDPLTGKVRRGGSCTLCFEELSASFVLTPEVIDILTDLYTFREEYDVNLKGTGKQTIHNVCLNMLSASNEHLLKDVYTSRAVYGGLLGRTFLIKPDEFRKGNSLLKEEEETNHLERYDIKPLLDCLFTLSKLSGEVKFTKEAVKSYNDWYYPLRERYRTNPDKTGVIQRIHTGVLKLAIVLGCAESMKLVIEKEFVDKAISECSKLIGNYEAYAMATGSSNIAKAGSLFLQELWDRGGACSKKDILHKYWTEMDLEVVDKLIATFEANGFIQPDLSTGSIVYVLTPKARELFEKRNQKEKK